MKWGFSCILLILSSFAGAEQVKTIFNPFTNKQDYITKIDSNTIQPGTGVTVTTLSSGAVVINATGGGGGGNPSGASGNVQYNNGGSFGGASFLNVHASSSSTTADMVWTKNTVGPVLTDSLGCLWRTTVATTGNLITSLVGCPAVASFTACVPGVPLGLLMAITCPR